MSGPDPEALLQLAVVAARRAGGVLLEHQRRRAAGADHLAVDTKTSATDPVSEADRAAERAVVATLLDARPDDGVLGEEDTSGNRPGTSGLRWVVDPLDGTVNYLYRIPQWCISVAAEDDRGAVVGVVHDPERDETFTAVRGGGARLLAGDSAALDLRVTTVADLDRTLTATGYAYDPSTRAAWAGDTSALLAHVRDLRRGGAAALDLAWVAAGRLDGYLEFGLQAWDWAAGELLVTEAGGRVSHVRRALGGAVRDGLVAGGPAAHDHLVAWLSDRPAPG